LRRVLLVGGGLVSVGLLLALWRLDPRPATAQGSHPIAGMPFTLMALLAFVAGMLGFASPCTLPLLPAYFAVTFRSDRKQVLVNTLAFQGGLALTFALFGALAGVLGQGLYRAGLNRFDLARAAGWVIVLFGVLSLMGRGFSGVQTNVRRQATIWGSSVFGATFALGWTSCTGPILGAITTLAFNANLAVMGGAGVGWSTIVGSAALLTVFAMGLGVPLILVSTVFGRAGHDSWLWRALRGRGWTFTVAGKTLHMHSTNLVSGLLFISLGLLMASGRLSELTRLAPENLALAAANWVSRIEEWLVSTAGVP